MKNAIFSIILLTAFTANAQTETKVTTTAEFTKTVSSENIRPEHFLPALGQYRLQTAGAEMITVTVDENNLGIIWVEGLPEGKFKALLKQRPSTYKIPAQKSETGKAVAEGILHVDETTSQLRILIGKPFNDADPSAAWAAEKKHAKAKIYTAEKVVNEQLDRNTYD